MKGIDKNDFNIDDVFKRLDKKMKRKRDKNEAEEIRSAKPEATTDEEMYVIL